MPDFSSFDTSSLASCLTMAIGSLFVVIWLCLALGLATVALNQVVWPNTLYKIKQLFKDNYFLSSMLDHLFYYININQVLV